MKTMSRIVLVAASAAILVGFGAFGSRSVASPSSVAVVDMAELIGSLDEWKERYALLEAEFKDAQTELDDIAQQIQEEGEKLEELAESDRERQFAIRIRILELQGQLQGKGQALQSVIDIKRSELLRDVNQSTLQAIATVAQQGGWDIVLHDDTGVVAEDMRVMSSGVIRVPGRRILHHGDTVDITAEVRTRMNNEFAAGR
ncbi:MAG: OmpH family outer membrane protein [Planctomycetota bacterium]